MIIARYRSRKRERYGRKSAIVCLVGAVGGLLKKSSQLGSFSFVGLVRAYPKIAV
jgi:hypothetical protein